MSIIENIKSKLPWIQTQPSSKYDEFLDEYGWIFMNHNKDIGDVYMYHRASNNATVRSVINAYIRASVINGYRIIRPDDTEPDIRVKHYLTSVFNNPHGKGVSFTFRMLNNQIWQSYKAMGDAFIEVSNNYQNILAGFKFIPVEEIQYYPDTEQWGLRQNPNIRYEGDELIHIYKPSIQPGNTHFGESDLDSIASSIATEYLGLKHNNDILRDDGVDPRGVISIDKDADMQITTNLINRLKKSKKRKGAMILQGASYQRISNTNQDMDFLNLMNYSRDRIIMGLGCQPAIIGVRETASLGAGTGESQKKDWQNTVQSESQVITDAFNRVLGNQGFNEIIEYVLEDIENKETRASIEDKRIRNNSLTINEVRNNYGESPVEWGDEPFTTINGVDNPLMNNDLVKQNQILRKSLLTRRLHDEYD